jgi:hypothetical protein
VIKITDYGAVKGVVNSCDIRRHVSEADSKSGKSTDPNEDTRAEHMHTSGCSDADIANFKDPKQCEAGAGDLLDCQEFR